MSGLQVLIGFPDNRHGFFVFSCRKTQAVKSRALINFQFVWIGDMLYFVFNRNTKIKKITTVLIWQM
jgi:hypothetical protein